MHHGRCHWSRALCELSGCACSCKKDPCSLILTLKVFLFRAKNRPLRGNVLTSNEQSVQWKRAIYDRYLWSGGKTFTLCAARTTIFQRKNLNYLIVCFTQCFFFFSIRLISVADLFLVRYLWDVCKEDKCCVVTHHAADFLVASLGLFTFSRTAFLLQLWIKTSDLDYSIWATPK